MSYVGNPLATAFAPRVKQDLTGQSGTSFTLSHAVSSANDLSVYINHIRQEPTTAYTVSYTTLTTTGSVASTDDFYIMFDELALQSIAHDETLAMKATSGTFTGAVTTTQLSSSGPVSGTTGTFSGNVSLSDNAKAVFGTGADFEIYYSGFGSYIKDTTFLRVMSDDFQIQSSNGGTTKLVTTATGIDVNGLVVDGDATFTGANHNVVWDKSDNTLEFANEAKAEFGGGTDLYVNSYGNTIFNITGSGNATGSLYLQNLNDNESVFIRTDNGSGSVVDYVKADGSTGEVILSYYGAEKLATKTGGVNVTGNLIIGTAGNGIDFSAQTPSSNIIGSPKSELLDHYETGQFNASVTSSTGSGSVTIYNHAAGVTEYQASRYVRIGSLVTVFGSHVVQSWGSRTGSLRISNLPFPIWGGGGYSGSPTHFPADTRDAAVTMGGGGSYFQFSKNNGTLIAGTSEFWNISDLLTMKYLTYTFTYFTNIT